MDREQSSRIRLARRALIHALSMLEEGHYTSALGLAMIAVVHVGSLSGPHGDLEVCELIARVRAEGDGE